jgi:YHS domain-containing protein
MKMKKGTTPTSVFKGKQYGFCNDYCKELFEKKPEKYVKQ